MERIVLRHLSGSKSNQVEEYPLSHVKELTLGRDPSANIRYDPDRDDLVGRQHARISQDPSDPSKFNITDLNSRNGTFVNKQRISGTVRLNPGDLVQFGPGGPEFQFDLEPRPTGEVKSTRSVALDLPPTVQATTSPVPQTRSATGNVPPAMTAPGSVGKNTVMRMINENVAETKKREGRKFMLVGGASLLLLMLLFGAVAGFLWWRNRTAQVELGGLRKELADKEAVQPLSANAIAKTNRDAVVKIEVGWRLISPTGGLVYHRYLTNLPKGVKGALEDTRDGIACYVKLSDGTIEPYLTYGDSGNQYEKSVAIGGKHSGTGFVVSSDGFILTNRHVAAAWKTSYIFPANAHYGIVYDETKENIIGFLKEAPASWVPANTQQELRVGFDGRNDRLEVAFPGTENRIAAQLVQASPRHDVALIKINVPDPTPKVEMNDNYDSIQPGDVSIVLGYPSVSPPVYGIIRSQDFFNPTAKVDEIPDPTLSAGNIGRVLRGREADKNEKPDTLSVFGDAYQLTINSTGPGNSGGPVFDDRGRVIGIFYAGGKKDDVMLTFAVPIRYGKELMSVSSGR